jgi:hypothetical protein
MLRGGGEFSARIIIIPPLRPPLVLDNVVKLNEPTSLGNTHKNKSFGQ